MMKLITFFYKQYSLIFTGILLFLSLKNNAQTTLTKNLTSGGILREYRIYIPAIYNGNSAVPIVFNFHGYTSTNVAQELYADFRPIADTANFILVHPQASVILGSTSWNNFDLVSTPDDVQFVSDMIDSLQANFTIDAQRIYATGLSNGGFMSYDLACKLGHRITAIASVSGSMIASHFNSCNPVKPTPIMQIHGEQDGVVSYNGQGGIIASTHIDTLVKKWVSWNHCNPIPINNSVANTNTSDGCTAEHYEYINGTNGSTVELYKVIGGGHTWPGTNFMVPSNGNTNLDFNACHEIWRFFRKFSLTNLTTRIEDNVLNNSIQIYPNPVINHFVVNLKNAEADYLNITSLVSQQKVSFPLHSGINSINITNLPRGIFLAEISHKGRIINRTKILLMND